MDQLSLSAESPVPGWHSLDAPTQIHIASYLDPDDLISMSKTCKTNYTLIQDSWLWKMVANTISNRLSVPPPASEHPLDYVKKNLKDYRSYKRLVAINDTTGEVSPEDTVFSLTQHIYAERERIRSVAADIVRSPRTPVFTLYSHSGTPVIFPIHEFLTNTNIFPPEMADRETFKGGSLPTLVSVSHLRLIRAVWMNVYDINEVYERFGTSGLHHLSAAADYLSDSRLLGEIDQFADRKGLQPC